VSLPHRGVAEGEVRVAIRPESLKIALAAGEGQLPGKVTKAAYLGDHMEYMVETPIGELFVIDRLVTRPIAPDTAIGLTLGDSGVTVVPR
jgi:iron(III) transport system ATP-binding protein